MKPCGDAARSARAPPPPPLVSPLPASPGSPRHVVARSCVAPGGARSRALANSGSRHRIAGGEPPGPTTGEVGPCTARPVRTPRPSAARVLAALGGVARRASARTPTPRRTSSAAGTATGCWSSSPRTPPTPPPAPACRAGCGWSSTGDVLRAANTGAPLDAAGVAGPGDAAGVGQARRRRRASAASASGFAAVLAVSDEPAVLSRRTAGCGSARTRTRAEVAALPALADELARRGGAVPGAAAAVAGRGDRRPRASPPRSCCRCAPGARDVVAAALAALPADLLLALPGLEAVDVVVDGARPHAGARPVARPRVRLTDGDATTIVAGRPALRRAAGRARSPTAPVEERAHRRAGRSPAPCRWTTTAARGRCRPARSCTRRPPATSRSSLPLRLIAPFPLGPDRRHVAARPGHRRAGRPRPPTPSPTWSPALPADPGAAARWCRGPGWPVRAARRRAGRGGARPAADDRLAAGRGRGGRRAAAARTGPRVARRRDRRAGGGAGRRAARAAAGRLVPPLGHPGAGRARRPADRPGRGGGGGPRRASGRPPGGGGCTRPSTAPTARSSPRCRSRWPTGAPRTARPGCCCPTPGCRSSDLGPLGPAAGRARGGRAPPAARRLLERLGARPATARRGARRPRRARRPSRASMDAVDDAVDDGPDPEELADAVLALVAAARPGARGAAVAGRAGAAGRRRRVGAGGRAGAARVRRWPPSWRRARSGVLDPATAPPPIPTRCARSASSTPSRWSRGADPDELDVDGADEWADAVLDRLPPDAPAAGLAAADRGARPGAGASTGRRRAAAARRRCRPRRGPTSCSAGSAVPGYLRWWLRTHPVLDGRRPDRLRHPDEHGVTGTVRTGRGGARRCSTCSGRPRRSTTSWPTSTRAIDLLDRLGDPAPHASGRRCCGPSTRGWPRRSTGSTSTRRTRVRVAPDRVVEDAVVLDAPCLQPLVDAPVVARRRRPGRGGRPARPAAGERAGARRGAGRRGRRLRVGGRCPAPGWPPPGSGVPR